MLDRGQSPGGSQGQAVEGRARHGLLRRGGWTARVHAGSGFRVLAVVHVPHPTHGLIPSSRRPPPRCELPQDRAGLEPSPPVCVLSFLHLPGPSKHLEEERLGDLPPALGQPLTRVLAVLSHAWYRVRYVSRLCSAVYRRLSCVFPGTWC